MQRWSSVWVFTVLILVLLSSTTEARRNRGKSKGDVWDLKAQKLKKRGFTLGCRRTGKNSSYIASLSVIGLATEQCHGLTASMLVQVNSCLWKKTCNLKANPHDQYMLRLYRGTPEDCTLQEPKKYRIIYRCARPQVPVIDLLSGTAEEQKLWSGIIRSHEDHPWLYRTRQDRTLTLVRPNTTATTFLYTILKLRLYNDVLKVTTGDRKTTIVSHQYNVTNVTADPIVGEDLVKFELEVSRYSTGEEGFVICFQWLTDRKAVKVKDNACNGLLSPGDKPAKMNGGSKRKQGKDGKRGRRKKNRKGRKGKTATTTTTPRP